MTNEGGAGERGPAAGLALVELGQRRISISDNYACARFRHRRVWRVTRSTQGPRGHGRAECGSLATGQPMPLLASTRLGTRRT